MIYAPIDIPKLITSGIFIFIDKNFSRYSRIPTNFKGRNLESRNTSNKKSKHTRKRNAFDMRQILQRWDFWALSIYIYVCVAVKIYNETPMLFHIKNRHIRYKI